MDRPAQTARMTPAGMGFHTVSAVMPNDLAARAEAEAAAIAAANATAFITGFHLSGGGAGATWRITMKAASMLGWAEQSACFAGAVRFKCAVAREAAEIDSEAARLLDLIAAIPNSYVWDQQLAGGGADGIYLIAIMYSEGIDGWRENNQYGEGPFGPFSGTGVVGTMTIPGSNSGTPNDQSLYNIWWSLAISDSDGSGVIARLVSDVAGAVQNYRFAIPTATDWWCAAGVYPTTQLVGATETFTVEVAPVGANTVTARHFGMVAKSGCRALEPT